MAINIAKVFAVLTSDQGDKVMPPAFRHLFSVLFQASWIIALSVLAPSASFAAPGGGEPGEHTIAVTDNVIAANIFGTMTQRDTWSNGELFHRSISFISPEGEKATTAIWQDGKYLQFDMPGVSMRYTKHSNTKHEVKNLITGEVEIFSAIPENPASYQYADLLTFDESLANYLYNFLTEYDNPASTAELTILKLCL